MAVTKYFVPELKSSIVRLSFDDSDQVGLFDFCSRLNDGGLSPPTTRGTVSKRRFLVTALHHGFSAIHTHDAQQFGAAQALGLQAVAIS